MGGFEDLPHGLVAGLADPEAYPGEGPACAQPLEIQTHISHVFLLRERVYKLRKAVVLPFLSFATRAERNADCLREVALNRRLAPDVYLGVAPVLPPAVGGAGWRLGSVSERLAGAADGADAESPFEHCVVMRRLPEGRDAASLLANGEISAVHIDAVACLVARFHAENGLGVPAPFSADEWLARVERPVLDTLRLARESACAELDRPLLERVDRAMSERLRARRAAFEQRRVAGRVVDGHGDLHLAHVWFESGAQTPIAIDCIEFDAELRRIDVAAELAFFAMDLGYRGRPDLAERFLRRYAAETDDYALYPVVDYHLVHRALVRAAVAGVAAAEPEIPEAQRAAAASSAAAHLAWAGNHLERPQRAALVLVCGFVGTGKSSAAECAADALSGVVIGSDRTRKRLAGMPASRHAGGGIDEGIYAQDWTRRVYEGLLERAEPVLRSGRVAILDATFSRQQQRSRARRFAAERGIPVLLLEACCDEAVVLARLERREAEGRDASDAGPGFYAESVRRFEPPCEWAADEHVSVHTDKPDWCEGLRAELERWSRSQDVQPARLV